MIATQLCWFCYWLVAVMLFASAGYMCAAAIIHCRKGEILKIIQHQAEIKLHHHHNKARAQSALLPLCCCGSHCTGQPMNSGEGFIDSMNQNPSKPI